MFILHPIIQPIMKNVLLSENGTIWALLTLTKKETRLPIEPIKLVQKIVYTYHMVRGSFMD